MQEPTEALHEQDWPIHEEEALLQQDEDEVPVTPLQPPALHEPVLMATPQHVSLQLAAALPPPPAPEGAASSASRANTHSPPQGRDDGAKRVKLSESQRGARRAELRKQIEEAEMELINMNEVKTEPPGESSPFRRMVHHFAADTALQPVQIDDSE